MEHDINNTYCSRQDHLSGERNLRSPRCKREEEKKERKGNTQAQYETEREAKLQRKGTTMKRKQRKKEERQKMEWAMKRVRGISREKGNRSPCSWNKYSSSCQVIGLRALPLPPDEDLLFKSNVLRKLLIRTGRRRWQTLPPLPVFPLSPSFSLVRSGFLSRCLIFHRQSRIKSILNKSIVELKQSYSFAAQFLTNSRKRIPQIERLNSGRL